MGFYASRISGSDGAIFEGRVEALGNIYTTGSMYASGSGRNVFVSGVEAVGGIQTSGSLTAEDGVYADGGIVSGSDTGIFVGGVEAVSDVATSGSLLAKKGLVFEGTNAKELLILTASHLHGNVPSAGAGDVVFRTGLDRTQATTSDIIFASGTEAQFKFDVSVPEFRALGDHKIGWGDTANTNYIQLDTDLKIIAGADILLDPAGGDVVIDANLAPNADTTTNLGAYNKRWKNVFATDVSGSGKGYFVGGIEAAGAIETSGSLLAAHSIYAEGGIISGSGVGIFTGGVIAEGGIETSGSFLAHHQIETDDHVSGSGKGIFVGGIITAGDALITGSITTNATDGALNFTNAASIKIKDNSATALVIEEANNAYVTFVTSDSSEGITFNKSVDFTSDVFVADDSKLYFGDDDDAYIEYDENGNDELIISGAAGGIDIKLPYAVADALTIGSLPAGAFLTFDTRDDENMVIFTSAEAEFSQGAVVLDDKKLSFGTDDESYIKYDEAGDNFMVISGSHDGTAGMGGVVLSGSTVAISLRDNVEDAFTIKQGGTSYVTIETTDSDELIEFNVPLSLNDNKAFEFGTEGEALIKYDEAGEDYLVISGSAGTSGIALSGSQVVIESAKANAVGGGFNGAENGGVAKSYVSKINGEIITTLWVNIDDLKSSATIDDIIGENDTAAAYLTRITTAVNGLIYKAEMVCVESPDSGDDNAALDIDLVASSAALAEDVVWTSSGTPTGIISGSSGGWAEGWEAGLAMRTSASFDGVDLPNAYLYLVNGEGTGGDSVYTAGKFMIKLYGVPDWF